MNFGRKFCLSLGKSSDAVFPDIFNLNHLWFGGQNLYVEVLSHFL